VSAVTPTTRIHRDLRGTHDPTWYGKLADDAGVRRITSHGARHTAGSSYEVMGAGQKVIASLLGHADTAATERYTHVGGGATAALVEARCGLAFADNRVTRLGWVAASGG